MTDTPAKPVLLTGASGALGRALVKSLGALGWRLVLTDIVPFPDALPASATFTRADLSDGVAILRVAEGCGTIIHLGGVAVERPFEDVIGPNIRGLYHVYEAARREKARVIFASSNHAVGFYERTRTVPADGVSARRVLWIVEGLRRVDGPHVLVQAWGGECQYSHRFGVSRAGECPDAGDVDVVWGFVTIHGTGCADAGGRMRGGLGDVEECAHDMVAR
jgi:NAD(P)-dependent dehydrogenase (short-subunit alcohol dehydrogenase family)